MINSKKPNTARLFLRTNKQRKFIKRLLGTSTTMFNELSESTENKEAKEMVTDHEQEACYKTNSRSLFFR